MPLCSLQALSTVLQTTSELRPRLNAFTLTLHSTFAVPKCTFHFPQNRSRWGDWWQGDFCADAICAFNLVRLSGQIISAPFPQESSVFNAETCISPMKHLQGNLHHAKQILKKMDDVKCQNGVQPATRLQFRPHWENTLFFNVSWCVCDVSVLFLHTGGKKGKYVQVWVVTLMTRSPLTLKLHLTVNFRGADVSARDQADAGFGAKRLSSHLENTGSVRCFHFLLTF